MNKDLEIIKKKYGEKMSHLCRELFPTILEHDGQLPELLQNNFAVSRNLYDDIKNNHYENEFQSFLYNRYDNTNIRKVEVQETPEELMQQVGYKLYKCNTEEQIQFFKKYYAEGELLCTFNDKRLQRCHVFFAIKDNADQLNRKDFTNPERQDEYGTSVISIQFSKGQSNITSIKNRYNTTVDNSDATFSNNLDNIVKGLTSSFEKHYNLDINQTASYFNLDYYKKANDKRFYKYYHKIGDNYYCENNIIINNDNVIRDYQVPERYIIMDNYILDLTKKNISLYKNASSDGFIDSMQNISKIDVIRDKETGNKNIKFIKENGEEVDITLNKNNNIIEYRNDNLFDAGENFLRYSTQLKKFEAKNLRKIGNNFMEHNSCLTSFNQPLLQEIPDDVLSYNENIKDIFIPNVKNIGDNFLNENRSIKSIDLPNVETIKDGFLEWNINIEKVNTPQLKEVGDNFLYLSKNTKFTKEDNVLEFENLKKVGQNFLSSNENITEIKFNNLTSIESGFLSRNTIINKVELPNVEEVGDAFLSSNYSLEELSIPKVKNIGSEFLVQNNKLEKLDITNVLNIGNRFLKENKSLREIKANNLKYVGREFMPLNSKVKLQLSSLNFKDKLYNQHIRKLLIRADELKNTVSNIGYTFKKMNLIRKNKLGHMSASNFNTLDTAKSLVDELSNDKKIFKEKER